ncbi:choice-of-anchor U domain-containing protein, partial [Delftia tsuruhatensis]
GGDCAVAASFAPIVHMVTPSAGPHGSIAPATAQPVNSGASTSFTVTPEAGYKIAGVTGCGGTLNGSTYTTGAIGGDCAVAASFAPIVHTVTPSAGPHGSISPATAQPVNSGASTSFTVTPEAGYKIAGVTGCGGTLSGSTYTTGAIGGDCAVAASFAPIVHTVTPSAGPHGSISPATAQSVNSGASTSFTVTPSEGAQLVGVTGCAGTLGGVTYATGAITADCTVHAEFALRQTAAVGTTTGSGLVHARIVRASPRCSFEPAGSAAVQVGGVSRERSPHGGYRWTMEQCPPGETVTVAVTFPSLKGLTVMKYGPTPGSSGRSVFYPPANLSIVGNTATYDVTDGELGDDDLVVDGRITDPVLAMPVDLGATAVPGLAGWAWAMLCALLAGCAGLVLVQASFKVRRGS